MKALLLAGGFGTRMRPLTYTRPKHLLPIANRPHIEHMFDLLQRHDVHEAVLLTSYLAEAFDATVAAAELRGMSLEVAHEPEPLDTAGAIKNAESLLGAGTFLAFNGDILTDVDLGGLIAWHRKRKAIGTVLLTPVEDPSAFGVVPTEPNGRVLGFIEKPPSGTATTNLINAGVYMLEPEVLDHIPAGVRYSAERGLFPELVASEAGLYATGTDAYWMDVGTPAKLLQANRDALEGRFPTSAVPEPAPGAVVAAASATVAKDATVSSSSFGEGVVVASGARVEGSVLMPLSQVGRGAVLIDSILGQGAVLGAGASVAGRTLGDGEIVD